MKGGFSTIGAGLLRQFLLISSGLVFSTVLIRSQLDETIAADTSSAVAVPVSDAEASIPKGLFKVISRSADEFGIISTTTNDVARLEIPTLYAARPGEKVVVPATVAERTAGSTIIQTVTETVLPNGSTELKTNRFIVEGSGTIAPDLPGVREFIGRTERVTNSYGPDTVRQIVDTIGESGALTRKTNEVTFFASQIELDTAVGRIPEVVERARNHRIIRKLVPEPRIDGRFAGRVVSYIELETGASYRDENGQWLDSVAEFSLVAGSAVAEKTGHRVTLASSPAAENPVEVVLPGGKHLRSRVLGLAYFDRTSGKSVTIAEVRDALGTVNPEKNQVTYADAFTGIAASLRYSLTKGGLEQDVILSEQPSGPESYGLTPETSQLEVITEFFPEALPEVTGRVLQRENSDQVRSAMAEPDVIDDTVDFGPMQIGPGRAFVWPDMPEGRPNAFVAKRWQVIEGRVLLFEAVAFKELESLLKGLPQGKPSDPESKPEASLKRILPNALASTVRGANEEIAVAQTDATKPGVVIDYNLVATNSMVLQSGVTYRVQGSVPISSLTIQSGAVVKYAPGAGINMINNATCSTSGGKAYFVAENDNTVGTMITNGAVGHEWVAETMLNFLDAPNGMVLTNLEFRNAKLAINDYSTDKTHTFRNLRIVDCRTGIKTYWTTGLAESLSVCNVMTNTIHDGGPGSITESNTSTNCPLSMSKGSLISNLSSLGYLRTNYPGWVGFEFLVGDNPIEVNQLGRWIVNSNKYAHTVKLFYTNGAEVVNGEITLNTIGRAAGQFAYEQLPSPVTLHENTRYLLMSLEQYGGDEWCDLEDTHITLDSVASQPYGAYVYEGMVSNYVRANPGVTYGPVNLGFITGNNPPTISVIPDAVLKAGTSSGPVSFTVGDAETQPQNLGILATSDNAAVLTNASILLGGSGANRTISVTAGAQAGLARVTVLVTDVNGAKATRSFYVSVTTNDYVEIPKTPSMVADSSSVNPAWLPQYAIDGLLTDPGWHVNDGTTTTNDNWLRLDLGSSFNIGLIQYHSRQNADVGTLLDWEIYVTETNSVDRATWGPPVKSGSWTWNGVAGLRTEEFSAKQGRYVIFRGLRGTVHDYYASAGEVWVYRTAQTKLAISGFTLGFNSDHSAVTNIASSQAGATVYYTIDGSDPTQASATIPPVVTSSAITTKARAFQLGYLPSDVISTNIASSATVVFSPNGHNPAEYSNIALPVQMAAETGATVFYKAGATGSWLSCTNGSSPLVDGVDNGNGTIQAYAFTPNKLRSGTTTSGEFSFRLPQPSATVAYSSPFTSGTLTLSSTGTQIKYSTNGAEPGTTYTSPLTLPGNTKVYARAYKAGYLPSGLISVWVNQLPSPLIATSSGLLTGSLQSSNAVEVWLVPNFGIENVYGEARNASGWAGPLGWTNDAPNTNFPGSLFCSTPYFSENSSNTVPISYGRNYSWSFWGKGEMDGGTYAGLINYDAVNNAISADDVNESASAVTWLTQPLSPGATTVYVANEQIFANISTQSVFNLFVPLQNFSRTGALIAANQPNVLSNIYQSIPLGSTPHVTAVNAGNHSITLSAPYAGPALPLNAVVARRDAGSTYQYFLLHEPLPGSWANYSGTISSLRAGTEKAALMFYLSYLGGRSGFTGLEFWEGAMNERPNLYYSLDGDANVFSKTPVSGPKKVVLDGNQEGTITVGQRGARYVQSSLLQRVITFKVASLQITNTINASGTQVTNIVSTATLGAQIHYTTDGTEPTALSTPYTAGSALLLPATATVKWKAFKANYTPSDTVTVWGVPTFNPPGGTYSSGQNVTITAPAGAQLKVLQLNANSLAQGTWVSGSQGSQTGFTAIGNTGEDIIQTRRTPYATAEPVWVANNLDTAVCCGASDPDGGFDTAAFSIDTNKLYRFSVWVKKNDSTPTSTSGYTYLGCGTTGIQSLSGTNDSNPYFYAGMFPLNQWYLIVGYVRPASDTNTVSASGVFDVNGNRIATGTDFKWNGAAVTTKMRSYLYYCTESGIEQEFWNPRVEQVSPVNDVADVLFATPENSPKSIPLVGNGTKAIQALSYSSVANTHDSPVVAKEYVIGDNNQAPALTLGQFLGTAERPGGYYMFFFYNGTVLSRIIDDGLLSGGSISIKSDPAGIWTPDDQLIFLDTETLAKFGSEIRYKGAKIATFSGNGAASTPFTITFEPNSGPTPVQVTPDLASQVLWEIAYANLNPAGTSGERILKVQVKDDHGTASAVGDYRFLLDVAAIPSVDAGPDKTITLPGSVQLEGKIGGHYVSGEPGIEPGWSLLSGPGAVWFQNSRASGTRAGFSLPGVYVLKLAVNSGGVISSDTVQITALAATQPLIVSAGPDRALPYSAPTRSFDVEASVTGSTSYTARWSKISGPTGGDVTFATKGIPNRPELVTAAFPSAGTYVLQLEVVDGQRSDRDEVVFRVCSGAVRPLDVAVIVDVSDSMLRSGRFPAAQTGILNLIDRLESEAAGHQIAIMTLSGDGCNASFPLSGNFGLAREFVRQLRAINTGSDYASALQSAMAELLSARRNDNANSLALLISDGSLPWGGECVYPMGTENEVASIADSLRSRGIDVAAVSVIGKVAPAVSVDCALTCGGEFCNTYEDTIRTLGRIANPGMVFEIAAEGELTFKVSQVLDSLCAGGASVQLPVKDPPPANAVPRCDRFFVAEDSRDNLLDVLANDLLVPGRNYGISMPQQSFRHGTVESVTVNGRSFLKYTPDPNYSWTVFTWEPFVPPDDVITYYLVENGLVVGDSAPCIVTITPQNDSPHANDDKYVVATSGPAEINLNVLDNDVDPDINRANSTQYEEIKIVDLSPLDPAAGTITIEPGGRFLTFTRLAASGTYAFSYTIRDSGGLESSARVTLQIGGGGIGPILQGDTINVLRGAQGIRIDVLANDQNPALDGSVLTITGATRDSGSPDLGSLSVANGEWIVFDSNGQPGTMIVHYNASGSGGFVTSAELTIVVVDELNQAPLANDDLNLSSIEGESPGFPIITIPVLDNDLDPEGEALTVISWTQGRPGTSVTKLTNPDRLQYNSGSYRGSDSFTYTVADEKGNRSTARVTVHIKASGNSPPDGDITNMGRDTATYPETPVSGSPDRPMYRDSVLVLRDATLEVRGKALDANALPAGTDFFEYTLTLSRLAEWPDLPMRRGPIEIQKITGNTPVQNEGVLGTFDLSTLPNGSYFVELQVQGGADFAPAVQRRFILENDLKLGDFTFTVEDLSVPVEGVPLAVRRTYSSLDANVGKAGYFGPGWTYSLVDLDVELDEMRDAFEELVSSEDREFFSKRVNPDESSLMAGRNVTLTIPGDRRTTFYFSPKIDNTSQKVIPMWKALPGIGARLELLDWQGSEYVGNEYVGIPTGKWAANGHVGLDGYDIQGFKLILANGTEYTLRRENLGWHEYGDISNPTPSDIGVQTWGKPYVSEIKLKSGARLVVDDEGATGQSYMEDTLTVSAYMGATLRKSLRIIRENGRIKSIYDPLDPEGTAALIYAYDDIGNLCEVKQRVKRTSQSNAEYLMTRYFYEDPNRPHFLTAIVDPRGKRVARNTYDEKGRLKTQTDGAGVMVTMDYDSPVLPDESTRSLNRMKGKVVKSLVVDGGTQQEVSGYDSKGNIVYHKTFAGVETGFSYDDRGSMTEQRQYFSDETYYSTVYTPTYAVDAGSSIEYLQSLTTLFPHEAGAPAADFTVVQTFSPAGDVLKTAAPNGAVQIQELDSYGRFSKLYYNQDAAGNPADITLMERSYPPTGVGTETERTLVGRKSDGTAVYSSFTSDNSSLYSSGVYPTTDPLGRPISATFDTNLRLTALTTDQGTSTSTFDDLGREMVNSFAGITTEFHYDSHLDWSSVNGPTLGTIARGFDDAGRLQSWTPPTGRTTKYAYDERGRLVSETDGSGNLTVHRFEGAIEYVRRPGLTEVRLANDDLGRPMERYSRETGRDTYEYYPEGRIKALHHQIASLFGGSHSPAYNGQALQPGSADWTFSYPIVRTDAAPSKTQVIDPLGRTSVQEFSREGLLKSTTGNSCCGNTQFSYLLDNPELDAEDYPTRITDAANRVRSFSYYLDQSTEGNIGQLQQATELANAETTPRSYTFKYFKPDVSPFTTQLKSVEGPGSSAATGRETLLQYTYDTNDRLLNTKFIGLSGTHDGLIGTRSATYGTTTQGATHLPDKVTSPNGAKVEFAYENGTGRVQTKFLERAAETSANAEERISYFYDANDSLARTEQINTSESSTLTDVIKMLKGRPASIGANSTVLADDHQFQTDDPVQFSTTGTLPDGLASSTIYYVVNPSPYGFQVATVPSGEPVSISPNGSGILSVSDGNGWSAVVQSEIDSGEPRNRAELVHRTWPMGASYDGWYEEVGVRALSNGNSTKTYVTKYSFNSAQQLQIMDVYVETGFASPPNRVRKFRIEFLRDAAGRLLARTAFKASTTAPDDDEQLTPVVEAVYTYYTNLDGSPRNGDWVQSIEHRKYVSGSPATLEKVTSERGPVGEPTKVTWNDGTSVTIGYDPAQALRVMTEDFSATAGVEKSYAYHDSGNRGSLNGSTWTYNSGYQLSARGGKSYNYDGNGNLSVITASPAVTLGYTVDDHLNSFTRSGSSTISYSYDAFRRRSKATDGTTTRRFVWGPVPGSDLEVIHMITDKDDAVKCVYVYAGAQPVARFGIDANTGEMDMSTLRFYLEDAMGSVLGLADQNGALTARFRYDGFGNAFTQPASSGISDPASVSHIPDGTGGDFRFQGAWLETSSGLYHMRARDYDPETGRFIERDPADPNPQAPETYNPYIFANSNPYYFSDPSGEFTVVEIDISSALQSSLQGFRTAAIQRAKGYAQDKIIDAFSNAAFRSLEYFYPEAGPLVNIFGGLFDARQSGLNHDHQVMRWMCNSVSADLGRYLWLYTGVTPDGNATDNGTHCPPRGSPRSFKNVKRPDFILGEDSPVDVTAGRGKSVLIGDFKLSGNSLYNQYFIGDKRSQFQAIVNYAEQHTFTRTAVFLTMFSGDRQNLANVGRLMRDKAFRSGVLAFVFSAR